MSILTSNMSLETTLGLDTGLFWLRTDEEKRNGIQFLRSCMKQGDPVGSQAHHVFESIQEHEREVKQLKPRDRVRILCDYKGVPKGTLGYVAEMCIDRSYVTFNYLLVLFDGLTEPITMRLEILSLVSNSQRDFVNLTPYEQRTLDKIVEGFLRDPRAAIADAVNHGVLKNLFVRVMTDMPDDVATRSTLLNGLSKLNVNDITCDAHSLSVFVDSVLWCIHHKNHAVFP